MQREETIEATIAKIIAGITPFDDLERGLIQDTLIWIQSGAPLFRSQKPDNPPKHLVSYFVLLDEGVQKILLVDHKKAQLWLPTGGHVELGEHPKETVVRECQEELGLNAEFWQETPLFLTSTETVGLTAGHTDVSLWYVIKSSYKDEYLFDREEFNTVQWFDFAKIPFERTDPHLKRFMQKLKLLLLDTLDL
ncbi:MAG: hydrolase [Chlamydiales bacterium]|jgi:8-oxo-dGTP pyrophosphatase MutT (NUDIX family)|nr:hydrolase [Chlamydiales bacterium]